MRTVLATLVMVLLVLPCLAQGELINIGKARVILKISGYTTAPEKVYLPVKDERQEVEYPDYLDVKKDAYGNSYIEVDGNYSYEFNVLVDASKPRIAGDQQFPSKIDEKEYEKYLTNSNFITPSDPEIKKKALAIVGETNSTLEAIKRLNEWVNEFVEYDANESKYIQDSSTVLKTRRGVCSEYANLYTALARSIGIPTRIASGIAYTRAGWTTHAWAESLIETNTGGTTRHIWIPVDPTSGEAGTRNAMIIKFYSAPNLLPEGIKNPKVLSVQKEEYKLQIETDASISETTLAPRQHFTLNLLITNKGNSFLMPTYFIQKTIGVQSLDRVSKTIVLPPGQTRSISWELIAPFGERERYTIFLKGPQLEKDFAITVDPSLSVVKTSKIEIKEVFAYSESGTLIINVKVLNKGNELSPTLVRAETDIGTKQTTITLSPGEEKEIHFNFPAEPGEYHFTVEAIAENETDSTSGKAQVNKPLSFEQSLLNQIIHYLRTYHVYYFLVLFTIGATLIILVYPTIKKPKKPFEEKGEWHKLVRV